MHKPFGAEIYESDGQKRLQDKLLPVEAIVFDFDGVFYPPTKQYNEAVHRAVARAVTQRVHGLSQRKALRLARRSSHATGFSLKIFGSRAFNLSHQDLHEPMHASLDPNIAFDGLQSEKILQNAVAFDSYSFPRAIATHGHRIWIENALPVLLLDGCFPSKSIFPYAEHGFDEADKARNGRLFRLAMDYLGFESRKVAIVEDSARNLVPIKNDSDAVTVYFKQGRPFDAADNPHIECAAENMNEFLPTYIDVRGLARKNVQINVSPQQGALAAG